MTKPQLSPITFAPAAIEVAERPDGSRVLRSPQQLGPYARCLGDLLRHWAERTPDHVFMAERGAGGGWRRVTYGETLRAVEAIGQALLDRDLGPARPLAILSENGIDHALLALGAMHVGVPAAPVSVAYSLISTDLGKLRHVLALLEPGMVFAADGERYRRALALPELRGAEVVTSTNPPAGATRLDDLLATPVTAAMTRARRDVGPDTVAKILFTSGSTDLPKGVINTQRMLCSTQRSTSQMWPFLYNRPPVIVDWLPWSHTFGGNWTFNMMLSHGGTIYIDEGKPAPGLIERTVANLKEISPTAYFNVPRGYDVLLPFLERDEVFRDQFFRNLDVAFYAAAALPQRVWDRLDELSVAQRGRRCRVVAAWGATETGPLATLVHYDVDTAGDIGLPGPGIEIKLVPNMGKYEMRVKGPNITPGYFKRDDLTAKAFDDEGWYITGDAGLFVDPAEPSKGLRFDGRIAEDFKLTSGTWVHVGTLRVAAVAACEPVVWDAVLTGHDREEIGVLAFANPAGCKALCPDEPDATPLAELIRRRQVRSVLEQGLKTLAAASTGSSTRICRALLMDTPPGIDANEITDKGYVNQRAVLTHRAALVERLYRDDDPDVIRV